MDNLEVKRIRESLGLTQQQLAKSCGVSVRSVQNWEAGSVIIPDSKRLLLQSLLRQKSAPAMVSSPSANAIGQNSTAVGIGDVTQCGDALLRALDEISAQRKVTEKAQAQIDELLAIIRNLSNGGFNK